MRRRKYAQKKPACGEESRARPSIMCTRASTETVVEGRPGSRDEEELEEERESDRDSAVGSTQGSDTSDGPARPGDKEDALGELFIPRHKRGNTSTSVTSDLSTRSSASLNEEQFEDYGEGEEPDYAPSSPGADDESRTHVYSDLGSSVPSSAGQTPRRVRQLCAGEQMDVYCSQCCKKVNLLNDLEARLKNLKSNRQLLHHSNLSSSHGSTEDLFRDSIDSCDVDINEKVGFLEKKVAELENDSLLSGDLKSKLKQENTHLVHRVHELEEQLKDQEARAEHSMEEVEKQRMTDKLEDTSLRLKDEMDLYRKMMDKLRQNRHQFQKEKEAMQEGFLTSESQHVALARAWLLTGPMENQKLREQTEELNGQLLSLSLFEAKNLFATQSKAHSSRPSRSRRTSTSVCGTYMDKIILSILDHNPSILEIKK
ncbi:hypothetical protein CRUP_019165 [Coryphaenoides rupestris]|nr:hypothetical protein CRUP_019165 [Coryphaenoides rupestris]